ncbi:MAG TPA: hypothetical protein PL017_14075 [Tenuifilaceae bacterium]|mgnify:CR=1 FL=1|nr:hypothetical protein [Tenuifilaceae bacterium]HPJ47216.1 hypothetical protein [Tenuifilaceae bacterium]HPQ35892.1 hypothetical protein [Tenuifilaceae bacterium]
MNYLTEISEILIAEGFDSLAHKVRTCDNDEIICDELIYAFTNFKNPDNQKRLLVQAGNSKDARFFQFIEHCIFSAQDEDIRHGALKYLPNFKQLQDLNYIFEKIEKTGKREEYEPSFSISSDRIGIKKHLKPELTKLYLEYNKLKEEVDSSIQEIESDEDAMKRIEKYYRGVQILFSNLTHRPKIMLIGINPGEGYYKQQGKRVRKLDIQEKLEYAYPCYKYALAINTRKLFELAGCSNHLADTVKTNCFFLATQNEVNLYKMLSKLKEFKLYKKSSDWLNRLIEMVEPEIIICEGKSAFDRVVKNRSCNVIINKHFCYAECNGYRIIGYRRLRSSIRDIEEVAKKLKEILTAKNPGAIL